jgi:hypothetical protein
MGATQKFEKKAKVSHFCSSCSPTFQQHNTIGIVSTIWASFVVQTLIILFCRNVEILGKCTCVFFFGWLVKESRESKGSSFLTWENFKTRFCDMTKFFWLNWSMFAHS